MALYWALGDYGDTTSIPINSSPLAPRDTASMQDLEMISLFSSQVYSKYVCLCLSVWVIYDYFLVTDDSVNLFWSHRWSISKVLFYLSRYMTILTVPLTTIELFTPNPSDTFCRVYPWVWLVGSIILMAIMNLVLISRIYALWNRSRIILIFTMFGLIFQLSWFFGVVAYTNAIATLAHSPPPFTGCLSAAATSLGWTVLVPPICNEAILIVLTAIKTYPIVVQHGFNAPLYNLLLRDGFLYFFLIIIIHVTSLISVFRPGPLTIILVVSFPGLSIIGVSCTRLLLRLQRALISGDSEPQTEFDRSEVTRNWPIVTFGGSGGNHKNQKTTGLNHTSAYRSQLPILALPRIDNGVRSSRIRHEHEEITIGRVEADGDGLTALELNIKSLDGAYDDAVIK